MLTTLGILFYFGVFSYLVYRILKNKAIRLSAPEMLAALGFKVAMACLYGYIFLRFYGGDDTWVFHNIGLEEYVKMTHDPGQFLIELLPVSAIQHSDSWWQAIWSYNMDLEYWSLYKLLAVCNFFSRGNYYINTVFFSFICFWGHFWLFKLLVRELPEKRTLLLLFIFFFPTVVFWLSGIRTDGFVFFFLSLSLIHFSNWIKHRSRRSLIYFLLAMLGVLVYRNVLVMLLIPSLFAWYLIARHHTRPWLTYLSVFGVSAMLFFSTLLISPTTNLPAMVAKRQHEYLALEANTRFRLDSLHADVASYANVLPQAVNNTFLRPFIWEASGLLQLVTAVSILFFGCLLVVAVIRRDRPWKLFLQNPMWLFLIFFGVALFIFIGYTVPFPGAIVRYKAIPELMLLLVLVGNTRFKAGKLK